MQQYFISHSTRYLLHTLFMPLIIHALKNDTLNTSLHLGCESSIYAEQNYPHIQI